jgi:aryl-alcohol dehydrogenase-like predicted oxidoreductase
LEFQKANGLVPFSHGQVYYSLLGRDIERDFVQMVERYKLGLTIWSPLAGGFLSGKYTPETLRDPSSRYSGFDILPFDHAHGFALVERLRPIAAAHNATVAQVALAWLLSKPHVTSVILGASKEQQLIDNLGVTKVTLAPDEIAALDKLSALAPVYPNWYQENGADRMFMALLKGVTGPSFADSQ